MDVNDQLDKVFNLGEEDTEGIPSGLNLKSKSVEFSEATVQLMEEVFENIKKEHFYCELLKIKASYLENCMKCDKKEECNQYSDKEVKLDQLEFLFDVNNED